MMSVTSGTNHQGRGSGFDVPLDKVLLSYVVVPRVLFYFVKSVLM